jgi:hypothetical protein
MRKRNHIYLWPLLELLSERYTLLFSRCSLHPRLLCIWKFSKVHVWMTRLKSQIRLKSWFNNNRNLCCRLLFAKTQLGPWIWICTFSGFLYYFFTSRNGPTFPVDFLLSSNLIWHWMSCTDWERMISRKEIGFSGFLFIVDDPLTRWVNSTKICVHEGWWWRHDDENREGFDGLLCESSQCLILFSLTSTGLWTSDPLTDILGETETQTWNAGFPEMRLPSPLSSW